MSTINSLVEEPCVLNPKKKMCAHVQKYLHVGKLPNSEHIHVYKFTVLGISNPRVPYELKECNGDRDEMFLIIYTPLTSGEGQVVGKRRMHPMTHVL